MWRLREISLFFSLALLLGAWPALALEVAGPIAEDSLWSGEVRLTGPVRIARGATLSIEPGTRVLPSSTEAKITVEGVLKVLGTDERPVIFASPPRWKGIEFIEAEAGSLFEHARFEGAATAIGSIATGFRLRAVTFSDCATAVNLLRDADPLIEDSLFEGNGVGIRNEMKSSPTIRGNRFSRHGESAILASRSSRGLIENNIFEDNVQAVGLIQKYEDEVRNNRFVGNKAAIFCNQTQSSPLIEGNLFENNENALVNASFSYPTVENNRFDGNGTAIRNNQYGSPLVRRNLFRGNDTALYNYRKSNPRVENNQITGNGLALFCDYSSYPKVKRNNIIDNEMAVRLGIYQSADWEKRSGSRNIVQKEAMARKSRNPLLAQAPTEFEDFVDVGGNWWGRQTLDLKEAGAEGNLPFFHDRLDQPEVVYEGFGPESYRLDRVTFSDWLDSEVADAGPEEGE